MASKDWIRRLYKARLQQQQALELSGAAQNEMLTVYEKMLQAITDQQVSGRLTARRAKKLRGSVRSILMDFSDEASGFLRDKADELADSIVSGHERAIEAVSDAVKVRVQPSLDVVRGDVVRYMMARRQLGYSTSFQTLYEFHAEAAATDIDRYLTRSIGQGVSAGDAKREIIRQLAGGDEQLLKAGTTAAVRRRLAADPSETAQQLLKRARLLRHRAETIAISEINTVHDETNRLAAAKSPVIKALAWRVSTRHDGLPSSPDECDVLESADMHGLGPGLYYAETKPAHPHPRCACYFDYVLRDPQDWDKPKNPPEPARPLSESDVERVFDRMDATPTDYQRGHIPELLNEYAERGQQVFDDSKSQFRQQVNFPGWSASGPTNQPEHSQMGGEVEFEVPDEWNEQAKDLSPLYREDKLEFLRGLIEPEKIDDEVVKGLNSYKGLAYGRINEKLRGQFEFQGPDDFDRRTVDRIDQFFENFDDHASRLEEDTVVYRGLDMSDLDTQFDEEVGGIWQDDGYLSTTIDQGFAKSWSRRADQPVIMKIVLPKGTRAASLDGIENRDEHELMLDRGAKLKIHSATQEGTGRFRSGNKNPIVVRATYIGSDK